MEYNLDQARLWYRDTLPAVRPTSFISKRDVMILDNGDSFVWDNAWVSVTNPFEGTDGVDGVDGATPVISIGNVATLPAGEFAVASISGAINDLKLNLGIPKGEKGDTGVKGDAGNTGETGPQGPPGSGSGGSANIGFVRWVTTATELNSAWAGVTTGSVRSIHLAADITLTQTLTLPANYNRILEIDGHGAELTIPSTLTNGGIKRSYTSLSEANAGIDCQLRIKNVIFKGSGRAVPAIDVQATYGSKIEGCRFSNFSTAIKTGWMMGTIIDQCYFWENNISIDLDYARFAGGSNSASQSNHSSVTNCKFRHSAGQFGAVKITAVSGCLVSRNIMEGIQDGPQYEVFFDDAGSTVVKEFHCYGNHIEQKPSVAAVHVRLKDGNAYVGGIYSQYDCTLISFDSAGYAKMIAENIPYLTAGTKFTNLNGAGRWKFINMPATFLPSDTTKWVGTPPINTAVDGWKTNGQANYLKGISVE